MIDEKALRAAFAVNHHPDSEPSETELAKLRRSILAYESAKPKEADATGKESLQVGLPSEEEIESVARGICTALGLDPDERVGCGAYDDDTPAEKAARFGGSAVMSVPAIMLHLPRWRLYRAQAAVALATQAALAATGPKP